MIKHAFVTDQDGCYLARLLLDKGYDPEPGIQDNRCRTT